MAEAFQPFKVLARRTDRPQATYVYIPCLADCARWSIRLAISSSSETNAFVFLPANVAASISVSNKSAVAKSPLHPRQDLSGFPGSPTSAVI
jgi:hypothetical protein